VICNAGRHLIAGRLLSQEALRVDMEFSALVANENMITVSLDGWSNCRMQSVYAFVAILSGRVTHLMCLKDLSAHKHTAVYLSGELSHLKGYVGNQLLTSISGEMFLIVNPMLCRGYH
jgi:hypothetical protein